VPANGYSPQAPNINVALWTSDKDRVTPLVPAPGSADVVPEIEGDPPPGLPDDFFVFAIGYKAHVYNQRIRAYDYLSVRGVSNAVRMPANALIGGRRGMRLHSFLEDDCAWATEVQSKIMGPQMVRVLMSGKAEELPVWTVNDQPMPLREAKGLDLLKRKEPYVGSVTFFTNGEVVYFTSIVIEGELNPLWVEAQLLSIAEKELKKIESDYPF
jgi:hypothetical protein